MSEKTYIPEQVARELGRYFTEGFDALYAHGAQMQDEVLAEIIPLVADSAYAHDHGFAGVSTKEEFLAKAPVSEYADYAPYIHANMQHDGGQLISLPTEYYLMTTGRNGKRGKFYSETHVGAVARQTTINAYQMGVVQHEPVMREPGFKTMPVVNSSPIPLALNGLPVRRTSSQAGKALWEGGGAEKFVFPYEFLEADLSEQDRNYLYALYALRERDLTQTNCNNLAAFGDFLDCIEANPWQMISDIRTGHFSVDLNDEDRATLEGMFIPSSQRADELEAALIEDGRLVPDRIWPRFRLITGWIGGSVGRYSKDVMARLPQDAHYYNTPYGCTEVMISATSNPNSDEGPLAVFGAYFEFLPLEGGAPVPMSKVQVGAEYEILATTYSGLCRFNLHDIVRITGFQGETACLEFRGRSSEFVQVGSRKLYGFQLGDIVESVHGEDDGVLTVYQGLVEGDALSLILEFHEYSSNLADYADRLKAALRKAGVIPGRVIVAKPGYRSGLYHALMQLGQIVQSMKLPVFADKAPAEDMILCVPAKEKAEDELKGYEQATLDAEADIAAGRVAASLPERLLAADQIELYYGMPELFADYERYERIVLNEIWLRVRNSSFGCAHDADKTTTAEEWLAAAPLTTYADYRGFTEASMLGAKNSLCCDDTRAYILTSGTTGHPKIFAESVSGDYAKKLVMRMRGFYTRTAFPITGDRTAKNLTFSNYAGLGNAQDGKPILRASGSTARSLRKYTDEMNIIPTRFWELADIEPRARDYLIAIMALSDGNLAKVFANNLAHFGRMLSQVDEKARQMIGDIRSGEVSADIPADARAYMRTILLPNPDRADELQEILNEHGTLSSKKALRAVWPRFALVSGWLNGPTGRDARQVIRRLPSGVGAFAMGYGSSEGKWNIPLKPATALGAAAPFSSVYEFRDLRTGELVRATQVQPKRFYELVVTTYSGLVRYNMQDVVYVDGFIGNTPIFAFCGKTSEIIRVNGRKRDSHNLLAFFAWYELSHKVEFDLVQACVAAGKLYFILESVQDLDYAAILEEVDGIMRKYWHMPVSGIYVVDSAYKQAYFDSRELPGRGVSGIKVPTVVQELPEQRFVKAFIPKED